VSADEWAELAQEPYRIQVLCTALYLAEHGSRVFPARDKNAPLIRWKIGASTNSAVIQRWFAGTESPGLAAVHGPGSGTWLLDVDVKGDGWSSLWELCHGDPIAILRPLWAVSTPSGGAHLAFTWPYDGFVGQKTRFADGLDTRGGVRDGTDGGYGLVPPSIGYKWLVPPRFEQGSFYAPSWLIERINASSPPRYQGEGDGYPPLRCRPGHGLGELEAAAAWIVDTPEGERNGTLFRQALRVAGYVLLGELHEDYAIEVLRDALQGAGLEDDEIKTVYSAFATARARGAEWGGLL
jgi:hypothetical protein